MGDETIYALRAVKTYCEILGNLYEIQNPEHQGIDTTKQISEYCTKLIREGVYSGGYGHE